jgi:uncharacterized protein YdeI (YjbR/CyaY-like superfamily)
VSKKPSRTQAAKAAKPKTAKPTAGKSAAAAAAKRKTATPTAAVSETPVLSFATQQAWRSWLESNHAGSNGVFLQIAKKGSPTTSVTSPEALEVALCYGWIDGQAKSVDAVCYLQKYTPRRPRSIWSRINRDKALRLIDGGLMRPAGLAAIEQAKLDGRWDAAYAGSRSIEVPEDLQAALERNPNAAAFFKTLNSQNRYAILFRLHTAKKAETRAKRLEQFVGMLARQETLYPMPVSKAVAKPVSPRVSRRAPK